MKTGSLNKTLVWRNHKLMPIDEICCEWIAGKMMEEIRKRRFVYPKSDDG